MDTPISLMDFSVTTGFLRRLGSISVVDRDAVMTRIWGPHHMHNRGPMSLPVTPPALVPPVESSNAGLPQSSSADLPVPSGVGWAGS